MLLGACVRETSCCRTIDHLAGSAPFSRVNPRVMKILHPNYQCVKQVRTIYYNPSIRLSIVFEMTE